jgi:hypothetical protein
MGRTRWLVVAVAAALLLPLAVLAVHVIAYPQRFGGDLALLELRVSDVFGRHTPLVGSYQRFGWNQPGPAYLYLLAIPYRVFGSRYAGLQIGALLFNGLAIVGVLLVAYRRGGIALYLWTAALLGVVMHAMTPAMLASFWEPDMSVLALTLLVFVGFDVAMGRAWTIPVLVVLTVILVQAWATTAPMAIALLVWALVSFGFGWFRARDGGDGAPAPARRWVWPAIVSLGAFVVLWIPPAIDQLRRGTGNVTRMVDFFRADHEVLGLSDAYKLTTLQLGTRAPWAGAPLPLRQFEPIVSTSSAPVVPILLVLLVITTIVAAWRRDRSVALASIVLVAITAEIISLSRLIGSVFVEIMQPTWACGFGAALATGWCAYSCLRGRAARVLTRVAGPLLALAILGFGCANVVQAVHGPDAPPAQDRLLARAADRAIPMARAAHGPVLVQSDSKDPAGSHNSLQPELLADTLVQAGVPVVVEPGLFNRYGEFRAHPDRAVLELRLSLASDRSTGDGWRTVTTINPLSAAERAHRDRLKQELDARGGVTSSRAELLDRVAEHPELRGLAARYTALADRAAVVVSARPITAPRA